MRGRLEMLGILVQLALRNLFASRLKTLIVGGIIGFGSALVVVGTSVVDSANQGMSHSIIGSAAGNLQVYDATSKEDLDLFPAMPGDRDMRALEDFSRVKAALLSVPNVKTVVPEGVGTGQLIGGNELDFALEKLRAAVKVRSSGSAPGDEGYAALKDHVRQMVALQSRDRQTLANMVDEKTIDAQAAADIARGASDEFWAGFDTDPLAALEFLENKVASLSTDGDMIFIHYIGTDLDAYQKAFEGLQMVEGTPVPQGRRGVLFPKLYYEEWLKLKTALRLDKIREGRELDHKTIATDPVLQRYVRENTLQTREIVVQLDQLGRAELVARLQNALRSSEPDVSKLLAQVLQTDDANFDARYKFFYEQVAPLVRLYQVRPGDTITIKAFTRSGYVKSLNVKLWGIFQFKGLEKSSLAGMACLLDLMSFRDLYGYLTADNAAEIAKLKESSGAKAVARDRVEDELFGSGSALVDNSHTGHFDEFAGLRKADAQAVDLAGRVYSRDEIERGVAVNVAVLLDDARRSHETAQQIRQAGEKAGLALKVVDWQKASGLVGQLIWLLIAVLVSVVLIIFLVALIIIVNSMVIATLQRVKEIGTIRAIGAQRRFVLLMIAIEALAVGLFFGAIGAVVGAGFVRFLGHWGIPAPTEDVQVLFSGPRLYPHLAGTHLVIALAVVLVVSAIASFYPAILATRITPLEAMQSED